MSVRGFYLKKQTCKDKQSFYFTIKLNPDLLHEKEIHSTYGYRRVPNRMS